MSVGEAGLDESGGFRHHQFQNDFINIPIMREFNITHLMKKTLSIHVTDIIHNHGLWLMPNIYASQAAHKNNIPLVITPRGMLAPQALKYSAKKKAIFKYLFQTRALKAVNLFHATSEQEYKDIRNFGLRQPVVIIPNGIDIPVGIGSAKPKQEKPTKTLLFLGRIHPIKGLNNLIQAWQRIENDFADWGLSILGPGDKNYISALKQLTSELGLERVTFGGAVSGKDKIDQFRAADLYILPSESENFGITVAEALSCETPVICTNGAPWSGLTQNKCGWWISQDIDSLEMCLRTALDTSTKTLTTMGKNGRLWMEKDFSWKNISGQLADSYAWLLGRGQLPNNVYLD